MSIIGPRPGDVESKDTYAQDEKDKLLIRPGITGYTQAKLYMKMLSQAAVKMQMGRLVKQQILNNYQKKNYVGCWKNFDRQACGSGILNHLEVRKSGKRKLLGYIRYAIKWHIRNGSAARNISRQPENYKV